MYFAKFQIMGNNYIFKQELKIILLIQLIYIIGLMREKIFGNALDINFI
jgi:uncharacterized membrane protein